MRIVVQKYGGSSVGDLARIGRVAERIAVTRAEGAQVVVVVSAMGATTDELIALAKRVSKTPDRRELDMLISVGERITMALVALALRERGIAAVSLTGSQSGIITDESHAGAKVVEVRPDRIRELLERGQVVIVAGFQGVSRTREITTLGRGGSDTTAVVLAAALGAEWCEICSDVDGVWTADPRVVSEAERIDAIGLDEALALARGGAKVLFEDAVRYARDHGVQLQASATFGPGAGTRLQTRAPSPKGAVAVTGDSQLVQIDLAGDRRGILAEISRRGGRVRRWIDQMVQVDIRNAHGGLEGLGARPVAVVTAVGSGLGEAPEIVQAAHELLAARGIEVRRFGAGGDAAWWEVEPARLDEAVQALHSGLLAGTLGPQGAAFPPQ